MVRNQELRQLTAYPGHKVEMMDKYVLGSKPSPLLRKILALLAELNQSRQGVVFYNHIKHTLEDWEATQIKTVEIYAELINLLLGAFASQLPPDSVALTHLKLVQTCLTPPLSETEINLLKASVEQAADILKHSCHLDAEELNNTLMPLLKRVAGAGQDDHWHETAAKEFQTDKKPDAEAPESGAVEAREEPVIAAEHAAYPETEGNNDSSLDFQEAAEFLSIENHIGGQESRPLKAPKAVLKMLRFPEEYRKEFAMEAELADNLHREDHGPRTDNSFEFRYSALIDAEQSVKPDSHEPLTEGSGLTGEDINFRLKISDENAMERLHRDFVRQMRAIVAENAEFGVYLGLEIDALDDATKIHNVEDRRKAILASMKKLSESHTQLAKKFDTAQTYLSIIESDKQKLSDELDRARMLSLTDELTALPNRRAFMRRLDDEVSRVKRYGLPLSLVLIDIDNFKQVNDKYGHAAGDNVLRVYAEKILSIFRHHDMIARYGGEEFAVLLPNTDLEGVLCALDKVKSAVPKIHCKMGDMLIQAPTFSAGVTEYRAPEIPIHFIERADHALYRAKRLGRNRIEVGQKDREHGMADQT
ncbi:MAG TPA: GGDEF domain-containing protein [Gammaproteobacteria bacterium]